MWIDYRKVFLELMFTTFLKKNLYLWGTGGERWKNLTEIMQHNNLDAHTLIYIDNHCNTCSTWIFFSTLLQFFSISNLVNPSILSCTSSIISSLYWRLEDIMSLLSSLQSSRSATLSSLSSISHNRSVI